MQSPDRANLARVAGPDRRTRVAVYHLLGSACCSPWAISDLFAALVRTLFCLALERPDVVPRILIIQHVAEAKSNLGPVWHCIPYRPHSLGSCGRSLRVGALSSNPGYHQSRSQGVHSKTSQLICSHNPRHDPTKPTLSPCESSCARRSDHCNGATIQPDANTRAAEWQRCIHLLAPTLFLPIRPCPLEHFRHGQYLECDHVDHILWTSVPIDLVFSCLYPPLRR